MDNLKDFMCACSPEGLDECTALYDWALADLKSTPELFLTDVVFGLNWSLKEKHYGSITGMYCDQWAVVSAEVRDRENDAAYTAFVQCDRVEHGLARVWKWAKEG